MVVSRKSGFGIAVLSVGVAVAATAGCGTVSNSAQQGSAPKVNNVVYFGNPNADAATLGDYVIQGTGTSADNTPFINTVVLFAANIDNQGQVPPTSPSLQAPILDISDSNLGGPNYPPPPQEPRVTNWIAPTVATLQAKGMKVLLGILPNHQVTGWSCPGMSAAAQQNFANQIEAATKQYNFDGISIDDEYSECPNDDPGGDPGVSYGILNDLRSTPTYSGDKKLITKSLYNDSFAFPPLATPLTTNSIAALVDQGWTEVYPGPYSDLSTYQTAGMKNSQLGLSASPNHDLIAGTQSPTAASVVQNNLGFMMIWATDGNNGIGFTSQQRAGWYSSALQGEFGNSSASVIYTGPSSSTKAPTPVPAKAPPMNKDQTQPSQAKKK